VLDPDFAPAGEKVLRVHDGWLLGRQVCR